MKNNIVVLLKQLEASSSGAFAELLRNGAKDLIRQAVEYELQDILS